MSNTGQQGPALLIVVIRDPGGCRLCLVGSWKGWPPVEITTTTNLLITEESHTVLYDFKGNLEIHPHGGDVWWKSFMVNRSIKYCGRRWHGWATAKGSVKMLRKEVKDRQETKVNWKSMILKRRGRGECRAQEAGRALAKGHSFLERYTLRMAMDGYDLPLRNLYALELFPQQVGKKTCKNWMNYFFILSFSGNVHTCTRWWLHQVMIPHQWKGGNGNWDGGISQCWRTYKMSAIDDWKIGTVKNMTRSWGVTQEVGHQPGEKSIDHILSLMKKKIMTLQHP